MKVGCLFSGGKDSNYTLFLAKKNNLDIKCLISIIPKNEESYMFQSDGNNFLEYQAEALNIDLIKQISKGEKENELLDLKEAIKKAIKKYKIKAILTGAIKSIYQASRIQKICDELNIFCINPIWQIDEEEYLNELLKNKFEIIILSIAAYPLNKSFLGEIITQNTKLKLIELYKKFKISPIGEGGEFETFILNSPLFNKKIKLIDFEKKMDSENSGKIIIKKMELVKK